MLIEILSKCGSITQDACLLCLEQIINMKDLQTRKSTTYEIINNDQIFNKLISSFLTFISNKTNLSVITNGGTVVISNGYIISNSENASAINNNSGAKLYFTGGTINASGLRQAIYNDGGTVYISGTAYLTASATERATLQNLSNGTVYITGGTIVSVKQQAVKNDGTMTIGVKDGSIDTTTPVLQGKTYGITTTGTLNFYDGVIKGQTNPVSGTITEIEDNATQLTTTEQINGYTYKRLFLT